MEDKLKYRIVGIAVIVALFALFAPILLKFNQPKHAPVVAKFDMPKPPQQAAHTLPSVNPAKQQTTAQVPGENNLAQMPSQPIAHVQLDKTQHQAGRLAASDRATIVRRPERPVNNPETIAMAASHKASTLISHNKINTETAKAPAVASQTITLIPPQTAAKPAPIKTVKPLAATVVKAPVKQAALKTVKPATVKAPAKTAKAATVVKKTTVQAAKKVATKVTAAKTALHSKAKAVKHKAKTVAHKTASKAKATTKGQSFVVQLASFSNKTNALRLTKKLKAKGFLAYTTTQRYKNGNKVVKVVVGPRGNRSQAKNLALKLKRTVKISGFVTSYKPARG